MMAAVPYRAVDRDNYGWYQAGTIDGGTRWTTGGINGLNGTEFGSYPELTAARGPVRPVEPVTDADEEDLRALFAQAGRKTVTTLAAALEDVFRRLNDQHHGSGPDLDGFQYARRTMMAGRAGSWESDLLMHVTWFGNNLNFAKETKAPRSAPTRKAGPSRRVDKAARDAMASILWRWVTDPARYTEVAATLASVVSRYADGRFGRDGWARIADQWLQPGGMARADFSQCYRLFYSLSEHLDTHLF